MTAFKNKRRIKIARQSYRKWKTKIALRDRVVFKIENVVWHLYNDLFVWQSFFIFSWAFLKFYFFLPFQK